jgi:putative DNA primase/helicase
LWGSGRNGKGTLLEVLGRVLGDLAQKAEGELLLKQRTARQAGAPNSAISGLRGRRLVWCSETGEGRVFDVARVKELVGGDTLSAREPYARRAVEFRPSHTLFLLTNSKPHADASDYAFWQRVHLIPFEVAFVDEPKTSNERKADKNLIETLLQERSGILSWLVRGCLEWQQRGLNPPDKVKAATKSYQEEEDIIGLWLNECCEEGLYETRAKHLYASYKAWSEENGYFKHSQTAWGRYMHEKYDSRLSAGTIYVGLKITETIL